jgi:hypothetical protein
MLLKLKRKSHHAHLKIVSQAILCTAFLLASMKDARGLKPSNITNTKFIHTVSQIFMLQQFSMVISQVSSAGPPFFPRFACSLFALFPDANGISLRLTTKRRLILGLLLSFTIFHPRSITINIKPAHICKNI